VDERGGRSFIDLLCKGTMLSYETSERKNEVTYTGK
jgi:hypothetical protein